MADDWTTGEFDSNPFDEFTIGKGFKDGKTKEKIKEETSFARMPLGMQELVIKNITITSVNEDGPFEKTIECYLNGEKTSYDSYQVEVTLALASNTEVTTREFFHMPPNNEDEQEIFATSTTKVNGRQKGFWWNKFRNFIGALGFEFVDGQLPDEATVFRNWRQWADGSPRIVVAEIVTQKDQDTKKEKLGADGNPYTQVNLFGYIESEDTLKRLKRNAPVHGQSGKPASQATATKPATVTKPVATAPASKPAASTATATAPKPATVTKPVATAPASKPAASTATATAPKPAQSAPKPTPAAAPSARPAFKF